MIVRNLVFQPPATTRSSQALVSANVDSTHLWLETRLGTKIEAFYIDRRAPSTILFSHANAEDVSMIYAWLRDLSLRLKVNVASYSGSRRIVICAQQYLGYTGYAASQGKPSEQNVYSDIDASWDYLTKIRGIRPDHIILYSRHVHH